MLVQQRAQQEGELEQRVVQQVQQQLVVQQVRQELQRVLELIRLRYLQSLQVLRRLQLSGQRQQQSLSGFLQQGKGSLYRLCRLKLQGVVHRQRPCRLRS
jgi:ribosomal protein L1